MKKYFINKTEKRIDIFNERHYRRIIDGQEKWYINVTHIIDTYSEKFGIMQFVKKNGEDSDVIRDTYAMLGSEVHNLIDNFLKGEVIKYPIDRDNSMNLFAWERFNKWIDNFYIPVLKDKYNIIEAELIVYNDETKTAGTIDLVAENSATNKIEIFDWKTSKAIFEGMYKQVSTYACMLSIEQAMNYIPLAHVVLINPELNNKWIRQYTLTETSKIEWYWNHFKDNANEIKREKPKFLSLPLEIS